LKLLAIETVDRTGSVALLDDARVLAEARLDVARRTAQTLVPAIGELLAGAGWSTQQVELVAVATGPGSFTGLRIGVTTAKTFAYAVGCPVVAVPTMMAIALRVPSEIDRYSAVLDAERSELFVSDFERQGGQLPSQRGPITIVSAKAWLESLSPGAVVTGPGLEKVIDRLPGGVVMIERALWSPSARAVGSLGQQLFAAGARSGVFDLVPQYFRRTAAEERRRGQGTADRGQSAD
jgi:tRNA threonylcarbamoyladenosine biosynthesis protein TsaB